MLNFMEKVNNKYIYLIYMELNKNIIFGMIFALGVLCSVLALTFSKIKKPSDLEDNKNKQ